MFYNAGRKVQVLDEFAVWGPSIKIKKKINESFNVFTAVPKCMPLAM